MRSFLAATSLAAVFGHGHITLPPARNNGSITGGGNSPNFEVRARLPPSRLHDLL